MGGGGLRNPFGQAFASNGHVSKVFLTVKMRVLFCAKQACLFVGFSLAPVVETEP